MHKIYKAVQKEGLYNINENSNKISQENESQKIKQELEKIRQEYSYLKDRYTDLENLNKRQIQLVEQKLQQEAQINDFHNKQLELVKNSHGLEIQQIKNETDHKITKLETFYKNQLEQSNQEIRDLKQQIINISLHH